MIKVSEKKCECGWPLLLLIRKCRPPWHFCMNMECPTRKAREERKVEQAQKREIKEKEKKVKKAKAKRAKAKKTRKKSKEK